MTASDDNARALEALGRGDVVAVVEAAKLAAARVVEAIEADPDDPSIDRLLERTSSSAEELLATAFPLIEYGNERALEAIPRVLLHVGSRTSAVLQDTSSRRVGGSVVLGRLVWALTTYAIHCGRFDAIVEGSRAIVRVPFGQGETASLIALKTLRYPDALGGNAGRSFTDYRDWIDSLNLIKERYPLFAYELDDVFGEADLLLALLLTRQRGRVYSMGHDSRTVPRLAQRLRDPKHRAQLVKLFGVPESQLDEALERAYGSLETDQRRWDSPAPAQLFRTDE